MKHALVLLIISGVALAEGQPWSVVGARTVELKRVGLEAGIGYPQAYGAIRYGVLQQLELGARVAFSYGLEGSVTRTAPGGRVQALAKYRFFDTGTISGALTFQPGLALASYTGLATWGLLLPVGLQIGLPSSNAFSIGVRFEVPFWVQFGRGGGVQVPLMAGVGLEYFLSTWLLGFARVAMGPTIRQSARAEFTLDAAIGVGFRLE